MTNVEKQLYEQIKDCKIEKININYEGEGTKITFDIINEIPELNERITLENASYEFVKAIVMIARGDK